MNKIKKTVEIGKLISHSFQIIARHFDQKIETVLFEGGQEGGLN